MEFKYQQSELGEREADALVSCTPQVIVGEANLVAAYVRRQSRWPTPERTESFVHLNDLSHLRHELAVVGNVQDIGLIAVLQPFVEVIRSEFTAGPSTGCALGSIDKFISYGLLDLPDISVADVADAVQLIADGVTHTRFQATDVSSDEVVLLKILKVLRNLLLSHNGSFLTDMAVCELMQTCFRICFQTKLSELLRESAEQVVTDMVFHLFRRLPHLHDNDIGDRGMGTAENAMRMASANESMLQGQDTEEKEIIEDMRASDSHMDPTPVEQQPENNLEADTPTPSGDIEILSAEVAQPSTETAEQAQGEPAPGTPVPEGTVEESAVGTPERLKAVSDAFETHSEGHNELSEREREHMIQDTINPETSSITMHSLLVEEKGREEKIPYGMPCVAEIFRFIVSITNIRDSHNNEAMINIGLRLLITIFEASANAIAERAYLMRLIQVYLSRYIVTILKKAGRLQTFTLALRLGHILFCNYRRELKLQMESMLLILIERIANVERQQEFSETALEMIASLCRIRYLMAELYLNYDCSINCADLFETLVKFLSKIAYPGGGVLTNFNTLALDALLAIIEQIKAQCTSADENLETIYGVVNDNNTEELPSLEDLKHIKRRKKVLKTGAEQFEYSAKKGIKFLQDKGILSNPLPDAECVEFLRTNPRLNKAKIGEYIGDRHRTDLLKVFCESFHFEGLRLDEAVRAFLEAFRLPGEAQIIDRIMDAFAERYFSQNKATTVIKSRDATYVLAFSIIMLNTDQHNPMLKKRMSAEDFIRNNRGQNEKENFPEALLREIYRAIKENEIKMQEEHEGEESEAYIWDVMLQRSEGEDGMYKRVHSNIYDHDIFLSMWGAAIAAISYVFEHAPDQAMADRALEGLNDSAIVSGHYAMYDVFDNMIISLCKFAHLKESPDGRRFSIWFGHQFKAQVATRTLMSLTRDYGDTMREAWKNVLQAILFLYEQNLLPESLLVVPDYLATDGKVSIKKREKPRDKQRESGLLSTLSYLLMANENETDQLTEQDREAIARTEACIGSGHVEELLSESRFLHEDSLLFFIKALINNSTGSPADVKSPSDATTPEPAAEDGEVRNGMQPGPTEVPSPSPMLNEDRAIFSLEVLVMVALDNRDRIAIIAQSIYDHLDRIINAPFPARVHGQDSNELPPGMRLKLRAITGVVRLANRFAHKSEMRRYLVSSLRMLANLKPDVWHRAAPYIAAGLTQLISSEGGDIDNDELWSVIFTLIEHVAADERARPMGMDCLHLIVSDGRAVVRSETVMIGCLHAVGHFVQPTERELMRSQQMQQRDLQSRKVLKPAEADHAQLVSARAMQILYILHALIPQLLENTLGKGAAQDDDRSRHQLRSRAWEEYWSISFKYLAGGCTSSHKLLRDHALTYMQRSLLMHEIDFEPKQWEQCFIDILFPMMNKMMKPDLLGDDLMGAEETRVRATALLCKTFLQRMQPLSLLPSFKRVWIAILDILEKFMRMERNDMLHEAVPESMKNMLLVVHTSGVFTSHQQLYGDQEDLWPVTWRRVDVFLPGLRQELFDQAPGATPPPASPAVGNVPATE
eukprot:Clim_evm146s147 gene=Clim_evmTU146s147